MDLIHRLHGGDLRDQRLSFLMPIAQLGDDRWNVRAALGRHEREVPDLLVEAAQVSLQRCVVALDVLRLQCGEHGIDDDGDHFGFERVPGERTEHRVIDPRDRQHEAIATHVRTSLVIGQTAVERHAPLAVLTGEHRERAAATRAPREASEQILRLAVPSANQPIDRWRDLRSPHTLNPSMSGVPLVVGNDA